MRLLALTSSYPRHAGDYCGRFVRDLHVGLAQRGHQVVTIAPAAAGVAAESQDEAGLVLRPGAVEPIFYQRGLEAELLQRPWRIAQLWRWLRVARSALERELPRHDALLLHWMVPCGWALPARCERPVIGIGHGGDLHQMALPLLGRMHALRLRGKIAALLCAREPRAGMIERVLGPVPVRCTPMGVDEHIFCSTGALRADCSDAVLGVGRFETLKGFDVILRAAALTGDRVALIGAGPQRSKLVQLAEQEKVPLHLPGLLPPEEVAAAMRAARVVVVPSRRGRLGREEGTPVVAAEALACGRPLLASATGGLKQWLQGEQLFEPGAVVALAEKLRSAAPMIAVPAWTSRQHTAGVVEGLIKLTLRVNGSS